MSRVSKVLVGYVVNDSDGSPASGVEVHLVGRRGTHLVWGTRTTTDAGGRFELPLAEGGDDLRYHVAVSSDGPRAIVRGRAAFTGRRLPVAGAVLRIGPEEQTQRLGDATPSQPGTAASVRGVVRHENGQGIAGVTVRVIRRQLGAAEVLSEVTSTTDGAYVASYTWPGTAPDLYVVALDSEDAVCGRSALHFEVAAHLVVDLTIRGELVWGPSTFERIEARLSADLTAVDVSLLTASDVVHLSEKRGLSLNLVAAYLAARRAAAALSFPAEQAFGLIALGLPRTPVALAMCHPTTVAATLQRAAAEHLVSASVGTDAEAIAATLLEIGVATALSADTTGSLGTMLEKLAPSLDATQRALVAELYLRSRSLDRFWELLAEHATELDAADRAAVARAVTLVNAVGGYLPMAQAVEAAYTTPPLREIAGLAEADWLALCSAIVEGEAVGRPSWAETDAAYASWLYERAESLYPSYRLVARIREADPTNSTDLAIFLGNNPTIDWSADDMGAFLAAGDTTGVSNETALLDRLRVVQRLYRTIPLPDRYPAFAVLDTAGFHSAARIASRSPATLLSALPSLGEARVNAIWRQARAVSDRASSLWTRFSAWRQSALPHATLEKTVVSANLTGFDDLFGAGDCSCDPCLSVLGPTAYFVDLLHWLDTCGLYTLLVERRPDLPALLLTCANAETQLPYVDLAIEILEVAVVNRSGGSASAPVETTWTTEELVAQPEHELTAAYAVLGTASWPLVLPYHHPLTQVVASLEHVGLDLPNVLDLFGPAVDPMDADLARVGASPQSGAKLLVQEPGRAGWGYETATVPHPASTTEPPPNVDWTVALRYAPEFAVRAGLTDAGEEIRDLLATRYVQTTPVFALVAEPATSCSLDDHYLGEVYDEATTPGATPGAAEFNRLHLMLRLKRLTGFSPLEIDKVMHALGIGRSGASTGFEEADLQQVVDLLLVHRAVGGATDVVRLVCTWSALLDTFEDRASRAVPVASLYDQLFLNPAVSAPGDTTFLLDEARTELLTPGAPDLRTTHEAVLLAAYQTTSTELAAAETVVQDLLPPPAEPLELTLSNLSWLYRVVASSQMAGTTVARAAALVPVLGASPWTSPAEARQWHDALTELEALDLSVDLFLDLTVRSPVVSDVFAVAESTTAAFLGPLRDGLAAVTISLPPVVDEDALRALLTDVAADPASVDPFLTERSSTIEHLTPSLVESLFGDLLTVAELEDTRTDDSAFYEQVAITFARLQVVTDRTSGLLGLPVDQVEILLSLSQVALGNTSTGCILSDRGFTTPDPAPVTPWADLTRAQWPAQFDAHLLLLALGRTLDVLQPSSAMLSWWVTDTARLHLFDLGAMVLAEVTDPGEALLRGDALRRTARLWRTLGPLGDAGVSAARGLALGAFATLAEVVATSAGVLPADVVGWCRAWSLATVSYVADALVGTSTAVDLTVAGETLTASPPGPTWTSTAEVVEAVAAEVVDLPVVATTSGGTLVLTAAAGTAGADTSSTTLAVQEPPPPLYDAEELDRLIRSMRVLAQLGSGVDVLLAVATPDPLPAQADDLRQVLRARYPTTSAYSASFRHVRDRVRIAQVEALIAWVHGFVENVPNHGYYLFDAKVIPTHLTTRTIEAISAVQQFVQRVELGTEEDLSLDAQQQAEWVWRRQYRVWEAARRVFLYPELYVEPELRSDKSHLFEELEQKVLTVEVDEAAVERAATRYADELIDLSNPDVAAVYVEEGEEEFTRTVHVFAQTRADPPRTFYRRYEEPTRWTPWEPLELTPTRVMCPYRYDGKLYLFWLEISIKDVEDEDADGERFQRREVEYSVHWTYLLDGRWRRERRVPRQVVEGDALSSLRNPGAWTVYVGEVAFAGNGGVVLPGRIAQTGGTLGPQVVVARSNLRVLVVYTPDDGQNTEERIAEYALDSELNLLQLISGPDSTRDRLAAPESTTDGQGYALTGVTGDIPVLQMPTAVQRSQIGAITEATYTDVMYVGVESGRDGAVLWVRPPRSDLDFTCQSPFVVQSATRAYLLWRLPGLGPIDTDQPDTGDWGQEPGGGSLDSGDSAVGSQVRFGGIPMNHPYAATFAQILHDQGIAGLLAPADTDDPTELPVQDLTDGVFAEDGTLTSSTFIDLYALGEGEPVETSNLVDTVDFSADGAQSVYNWELFFHLSAYTAQRLRAEGRFPEALAWWQYLFDPRRPAAPWRVAPLRDALDRSIADWMEDPKGLTPAAVDAWRADPFDPHPIAQNRPESYRRFAILRYTETLLDWADSRYVLDTRETIAEAAQLYQYARQVIGSPPEVVKRPPSATEPQSFSDLRESLDEFSNAIVALENVAGPTARAPSQVSAGPAGITATAPYFCVPRNDQIDLLWARIDDRLFKLRNGMDIEGRRRTLPLLSPPIDPAQLVAASAAGVSLGTAIDSLGSVPPYRFGSVLGRAKEVAGMAAQLGGSLLSALEKRDAERIAQLRESQEVTSSSFLVQTRQLQLEEARTALTAAKEARQGVRQRRDYYQKLLDHPVLAEEQKADTSFEAAEEFRIVADGHTRTASVLSVVPDASVGVAAAVTFGGTLLSTGASALASLASSASSGMMHLDGRFSRMATRLRREQDWQQQVDAAKQELEQHDALVEGAQLRVEVARRELDLQVKQADHARRRSEVLTSKFTNQELYAWMVQSLRQLHTQIYQLAFDLARQAEAAFRYELAEDSVSFVRFTNWDGAHRGLLAGEHLQFDLHRLERAFQDRDRRELQITKHVSLAQVDPDALFALQELGTCTFTVPELWFDFDYPGHYLRRIKGVSVSLPCVSGPFGSVNGLLTLDTADVRTDASASTLRHDVVGESIAVSGAQDESGVFNFSFDGARFMPFERRGAVSSWTFTIAKAFAGLDLRSIADLVLQIRYTARAGGSTTVSTTGTTFHRMVSAKHDFPDAWHAFLNPEGTTAPTLTLPLTSELFPRQFSASTLTLEAPTLRVRSAGPATVNVNVTLATTTKVVSLALTAEGAVLEGVVTEEEGDSFGTITAAAGQTLSMVVPTPPTDWQTDGELDPAKVSDVLVLLPYQVS